MNNSEELIMIIIINYNNQNCKKTVTQWLKVVCRSILDKLIGAQNSGKAPAGQPTIPDLATEVD